MQLLSQRLEIQELDNTLAPTYILISTHYPHDDTLDKNSPPINT
jgi:hypothetical protein